MKRFVISLLISGILFYFAFSGVDWGTFKESLAHIDYRYLLGVLPILLVIQWMRSYRWGVILNPVKKVDQGTLFSITSVGFMGILLLPARTGELLRPYLISQKGVDLRSALATIVVERVMDGLTIMSFFVWVILLMPLPVWVHRAGYLSFALYLFLLLLLFLTAARKEKTLSIFRTLTKRFPSRVQNGVQAFILSFSEGLKILPDLRSFGFGVSLSVIIWALMGLVFYILLHSFHVRLPLIAGYVVLVLVVIGVTIPGAPGFVGNFHLFYIFGLSLFEIPKAQALSCSIVNHLVVALFTVALGVIFLPRIKTSWPYLIKNKLPTT